MTYVVSHHHHRQSLRSILILHSWSTNIYTSAFFNESSKRSKLLGFVVVVYGSLSLPKKKKRKMKKVIKIERKTLKIKSYAGKIDTL